MPEPTLTDMLDEDQTIDQQNVVEILNWAIAHRTFASYWRGRCEGMEREIAQIKEAHELTIGYLKDRLNRLEKPAQA